MKILKYIGLSLAIILSFTFSGCGGGGGSSSTGNNSSTAQTLSIMDMLGEWQYVATLSGCNKQETGTIVTSRIDENTFSYTMSSNNGLEEDCTYSGAYNYSGTVDAPVSNMSLEQFKAWIISEGESNDVNIVFNSNDKITATGDFTTVFTRNDSSFDGNHYVGTATLTNGNYGDCASTSSVNANIIDSHVYGTAKNSEGTINIDGYAIKNGKYMGTTSDGTSWSGIVTSEKSYGTYTNSKWNCAGTYELLRQ